VAAPELPIEETVESPDQDNALHRPLIVVAAPELPIEETVESLDQAVSVHSEKHSLIEIPIISLHAF
jgi:hypothetical protein